MSFEERLSGRLTGVEVCDKNGTMAALYSVATAHATTLKIYLTQSRQGAEEKGAKKEMTFPHESVKDNLAAIDADNALAEIDGAGFGIRALARIIDIIIHYLVSFIVGIALVIAIYIIAAIMGRPGRPWMALMEKKSIASYMIILLAPLAYHTICEGLHGSTAGKLVLGLVAISEDGKPASVMQAFKRSLAFYVDGLFFAIPAAVSMSKSKKQQRIGDNWAKTMVVKRRDVANVVALRSGLRFVVIWLAAMAVDGLLIAVSQLIKLI